MSTPSTTRRTGAIDVQLLDCDFLACSPYKFYGPHSGVLYGKREALERLQPYKVRPASEQIPDCFETGTKNHEGIAGVAAAIDFLAALGRDFGQEHAPALEAYAAGRRRWLKQALAAIKAHETRLFSRLLAGLQAIPGLRVYGITDPARFCRAHADGLLHPAGPGAGRGRRKAGRGRVSMSGTATITPGSR